MLIDSLLTECVNKSASDVHIKEWEQIMLRIEWCLISSDIHSHPNRLEMFDFLYNFLNRKKERISSFKNNMELDFGYIHKDGTSYRGNAYMYMNKIGIALRRISDKMPNLIELWIPKSIGKVLQSKQGLFLVTWPTGSWKSTTMASMIDAINEVRGEHILTIEDPIEYVFHNKKSIISQREIWRDTRSFPHAIRSAMREDADIIMIGEIRDSETMEIALSLAETWHLVFSTLHTSWSIQTINRIIQFFPTEIEMQIRTRISDSLIWVLSQRLIPRTDDGRIAIREIMFNNNVIRNLISKWDLLQIPNVIETSGEEGMITMRHYAELLKEKWTIEEKSYRGFFMNE